MQTVRDFSNCLPQRSVRVGAVRMWRPLTFTREPGLAFVEFGTYVIGQRRNSTTLQFRNLFFMHASQLYPCRAGPIRGWVEYMFAETKAHTTILWTPG